MVPVDGRVAVERLEALQAPVATAHLSFDAADDRLSARDSSGFVGPLRTKYDDLAGRVAEAAGLLGTADRALQVLPTMLGADGPKSYLLVFQNNAEVRATGGLPGAISVVTADDGRLTMGEQTTAVKLGEADEPVLPLTPAEQEIYGPQLGTYFLDANFTPSFPRAADLMAARWAQRKGQQVDGVLAVDTVAVSYVLGATGPVTVGPAQLTSSNAVESLLHQIYLLIDDTDEQDELFKETARDASSTSSSRARPTRRACCPRSAAVRDEDRLLVHSFDPTVQAVLDGGEVAGELDRRRRRRDRRSACTSTTTPARRCPYYLRTVVRGESTSCTDDGVQTVKGVTRMTSDAPVDAGHDAARLRDRRRALRHRPRRPARRAADLRPGRRHHRRGHARRRGPQEAADRRRRRASGHDRLPVPRCPSSRPRSAGR